MIMIRILLHEYIMQIEFLNTEIKNIESKITCEASKNESVKILMSMTGIDYFSAMMIAAEIGDITRFSTTRKASILVWIMSIHSSIRELSLHGKDEGWKQEVRGKTKLLSPSQAQRLLPSLFRYSLSYY